MLRELLDERGAERDGLAGARAATAEDVLAGDHVGDRRGLDRERAARAELLQGAGDVAADAEVAEGHALDVRRHGGLGLELRELDVVGGDELAALGLVERTAGSAAVVAVEAATGTVVIVTTGGTVIAVEAATRAVVVVTTRSTVVAVEAARSAVIAVERTTRAVVVVTTGRTVIAVEATTRAVVVVTTRSTVVTVEAARCAVIAIERTTRAVVVVTTRGTIVAVEATRRAVVTVEAATTAVVTLRAALAAAVTGLPVRARGALALRRAAATLLGVPALLLARRGRLGGAEPAVLAAACGGGAVRVAGTIGGAVVRALVVRSHDCFLGCATNRSARQRHRRGLLAERGFIPSRFDVIPALEQHTPNKKPVITMSRRPKADRASLRDPAL
ncbi:hypothetical protein QP157_00380 [Sphingomonas sp. LR61]|uniref:hypothetical protein n=1 Tax=Sphingomonas sp. LR61 TaxID=3050234 RepID=UPI002FDF31C7